MNLKRIFLLIIGLLLVAAGCNARPPYAPPLVAPERPDVEMPEISNMPGVPTVPQMPEIPMPSDDAGAFDRPDFEMNMQWPDSIPDEIPAIPADITMVFEDDDGSRIFFENMTRAELQTYIAWFEQNGFAFEYVVYTREDFPDNSEERIARGEYDAVRLAKGDYHITIEHGEDVGTMDISF